MIELKTVSHHKHGVLLVRDVSLEIGAGEVVSLLGPNGAGKSTLLKLIAGDLRPSSGSITIDRRDLGAWPAMELAAMRAVVPQESTLAFPFTAFEVVLLGRAPHSGGRETARDRAIARDALEAVDAGHLSSRRYPTLSGGERQRVHLARALAQIREPRPNGNRFLLLDEPTSNLDLAHQHATLALARRLSAAGVGVLVVLHDLNLAAHYADRMVVLHRGTVVAQGTPRAVLTPELIRTVFGVPAVITHHPQAGTPLVIPTHSEYTTFQKGAPT